MYLTQNAQILAEEFKNHEKYNEKNILKKISGVSANQIQHLVAQFFKDKLRREGLLTRNISNLITVNPAKAFPIRNILMIFNRMADELIRLHPRTFSNLQIVPDETPLLIESIGRNLFRQDDNIITWGKIISFLTLAAAFAAECIKTGAHDIIQPLIYETCSVLNEETGLWIESQGGLESLTEHIKPVRSKHMSFLGLMEVLVGFLFIVHWSWIAFKYLGEHVGSLNFW